MATKDAAFLWETEALRASGNPVGKHERQPNEPGEGWLTLRETETITGIPISTLRKWVRKDAVPSFLDETGQNPVRMIWLKGVTQRAEVLGRDLGGEQTHGSEQVSADLESNRSGDPEDETKTPPPAEPQANPTEPVQAKPRPVDMGITSAEASGSRGQQTDPPPGTMIVPIEAWDKMLIQLGNLHEAGQQLAEARERAGKAETEAKFLRERLGELRERLSQGDPAPLLDPDPTPVQRGRVNIEIDDGEDGENLDPDIVEEVMVSEEPAADGSNLSTYSIEVVKHLYSTWRDRPRRGA